MVYTWPEVAAVGKTEEELKEAGVEYKSGQFPMRALGRSRASMDLDGFVKILADKKTRWGIGRTYDRRPLCRFWSPRPLRPWSSGPLRKISQEWAIRIRPMRRRSKKLRLRLRETGRCMSRDHPTVFLKNIYITLCATHHNMVGCLFFLQVQSQASRFSSTSKTIGGVAFFRPVRTIAERLFATWSCKYTKNSVCRPSKFTCIGL